MSIEIAGFKNDMFRKDLTPLCRHLYSRFDPAHSWGQSDASGPLDAKNLFLDYECKRRTHLIGKVD